MRRVHAFTGAHAPNPAVLNSPTTAPLFDEIADLENAAAEQNGIFLQDGAAFRYSARRMRTIRQSPVLLRATNT